MDCPTYPFTLYRWRMRSSTTGKLYNTRHRLTEAAAKAQDPNAVCLGDAMVIDGPAVPHSTPANCDTRPR